jgi:hypothetical protein
MIDCYNFKKNISKYLDGAMNDRERLLFEEHRSYCPECGTTFEQLKSIKSRLASLTVYKTSSNFDIVLRSRLRDEINRQRPFLNLETLAPVWRVAFYATAIVVLIYTGILLEKTLAPERTGTPDELQIATTQVSPVPEQAKKIPAEQTAASRRQYTKMTNYMPMKKVAAADIIRSHAEDRSRSATGIPGRSMEVTDHSIPDTLLRTEGQSSPLIQPVNHIVQF